jgi:hypothetical protein
VVPTVGEARVEIEVAGVIVRVPDGARPEYIADLVRALRLPLATLMEQPIFRMMEPGGGTQDRRKWFHVCSRESSTARSERGCGGAAAAWVWLPEAEAEARPCRRWA